MNKWIELIIGLILVLNAIVVAFNFLPQYTASWSIATWQVLKGGIVWGIFGIGLLFIMLGISDLKG